MGKDVADTLFRQIDEAIVYSLKSVQNVIINDRRCFELYGYDFILFIVRAIRMMTSYSFTGTTCSSTSSSSHGSSRSTRRPR